MLDITKFIMIVSKWILWFPFGYESVKILTGFQVDTYQVTCWIDMAFSYLLLFGVVGTNVACN